MGHQFLTVYCYAATRISRYCFLLPLDSETRPFVVARSGTSSYGHDVYAGNATSAASLGKEKDEGISQIAPPAKSLTKWWLIA